MKKKLAAVVIAAGTIVGVGAASSGSVSAHPLQPNGNDKTIAIGGPLDKAQGHFKALECVFELGKTPIGSAAGLGVTCDK